MKCTDSNVETAMLMYATVVFQRYCTPQRTCVSNEPLWSHLYTRGQTPCVRDGIVCWQPPLCKVKPGMRWCNRGRFEKIETDEDEKCEFKFTEAALQEIKRRRVN